VATTAELRLDEPLRLTDVIAEAVRAYGRHYGPLLGLGMLHAGAYLVQSVVPWVVSVVILSAVFVISYGVIAGLLAGEDALSAVRRVGRGLPLLLLLAVGVGLPFYLSLSFLIFIPIAIIWLAVFSFAVPIALLEPRGSEPGRPMSERASFAIRRSAYLARTDFAHALSVVLVLVLIYLFVGILIAGLLSSFADNSQTAAIATVQVVLAPFFFLGLGVLYFSQRARAETGDRPLPGRR
jgi:hypothetical protein